MCIPCNSQCMVDGLMDGVDLNGLFHCLTGPLIGSLSINIALFHPSTKHQHGAAVGKVTMHSIILDIMNDIRLIYLLLYFSLWTAFHHHVSTEFTRQND